MGYKVYRWRSKYGEMNQQELQRLREIESENARLQKIFAQQALDIDALKDVVARKMVSTDTKRRVVAKLM